MTKTKLGKNAARMSQSLLVRGIRSLFTLDGAAKKSARRITTPDLGEIKQAALAVIDGKIVYAGSERKLPRGLRSQLTHIEDLGGATVLPALSECHTHLLFAGNRAAEFERRIQGESYQEIAKSGGGIMATVLATRKETEAKLVQVAQKRVERFLRQGVTTIEIKSGYGLTIEGELKMLRAMKRLSRARVVPTFLGAHAIPREYKGNAEAWINELISKSLPLLDDDDLACRVDIFVEEGYFSKSLARKYLQTARDFGFDLVLHADQLTHSGGAELAIELGVRSADHLLRINKQEIKALAKSDVTCVLLPNSDLYMNCPYPPARALIDSGARVALATDFNPGSAPSQDTALVGVLARVLMKMTLPEVIAAYTIGAAHALGLADQLGSLSLGKRGDFIVLDGGIEELFLQIGYQPVVKVYREGHRLI
jgi:imidazolonepropionase